MGPAATNRYDNPVIRRSISDLSDVQKLEFLIGFQRLQQLPTNNPYSFWAIAGFHGRPYVTSPDGSEVGIGWCNHRNVLFPTWHRCQMLLVLGFFQKGFVQNIILFRAHLRHFEIALQTVMPDSKEPMALHYWAWEKEEDIPDLLTQRSITINGHHFETNPLHHYKFQEKIEFLNSSKEKEFIDAQDETLRYPFRIRHGNESDKEDADKHNQ